MWHRKPVVAGAFYPAEKSELQHVITRYLDDADPSQVQGEVVAVISPHAGYIYSGPVAAYSYRLLKELKPEVVIVLAPSHRGRFNGASVIPGGEYETPLGNVKIDETIGRKLVEKPHFSFLKEAHQMEHSLEVQVPFLQSVIDSFTLVPVVIGTIDLDVCRELAGGIADAIDGDARKIAIVISTDLSHYHSYESAKSLDAMFMDGLRTFSEQKIKEALKHGAEACGEGPVLTGVILSKKLGAGRVEILKYATSGDTAGDKSQVVGYLAAAIMR